MANSTGISDGILHAQQHFTSGPKIELVVCIAVGKNDPAGLPLGSAGSATWHISAGIVTAANDDRDATFNGLGARQIGGTDEAVDMAGDGVALHQIAHHGNADTEQNDGDADGNHHLDESETTGK